MVIAVLEIKLGSYLTYSISQDLTIASHYYAMIGVLLYDL